MMAATATTGDAYAPTISAAEQNNGIPSGILYRLLSLESGGFDPNVISGQKLGGAGEVGIAQFLPSTAKTYNVNPYNPRESINGAARFIRDNLALFGGDIRKALAGYNAGPLAVQTAINKANATGGDWFANLPQSTQGYVNTITGASGQSAGISIPPLPFAPLGGTIPFPDVSGANFPDWLKSLLNVQSQSNGPNAFQEAATVAKNIVDPHFWAKTGLTFVAAGLIIGGIIIYIQKSPAVRDVEKGAATAA